MSKHKIRTGTYIPYDMMCSSGNLSSDLFLLYAWISWKKRNTNRRDIELFGFPVTYLSKSLNWTPRRVRKAADEGLSLHILSESRKGKTHFIDAVPARLVSLQNKKEC